MWGKLQAVEMKLWDGVEELDVMSASIGTGALGTSSLRVVDDGAGSGARARARGFRTPIAF